MRVKLLALAAAAAATALLLVTAWANRDRPRRTPGCPLTTRTVSGTQIPPSVADRYGYNAHIEQQADPVRYVALIRDGAADTVRDDVDWPAVEPAKGRFNWSEPDRWIGCAARAGLHPLLGLTRAPAWASGSSSQYWTPPRHPSDFGAFAAAVASRYGAGGTYWKQHPTVPIVLPAGIELWNEPNVSAFWGGLKPDPQKFAAMVKSAYTAVKSIDPNLTVVTGGLAPAGGYNDIDCNGTADRGSNARSMNPLTFLQAMYAAGARGTFDALGWHPYNYAAGTTASKLLEFDRCSAWSQMGDTSPSARSIMTANGDGGKKIWITEVGAPTCVPSAAYPCLSETEQARLASQAMRLWESWSWAGNFYWYDIRDDSGGGSMTTPEQHFGAVRADGKPKPSYFALKEAWSTR